MTASFFVRLEDGNSVRRTILESSKSAIHCLRAYQDLIRVRGEKAQTMDVARKQLRELTVILNELEKLLPTVSSKEMELLRPVPQEDLPSLDDEVKSVVSKARKGKKQAPPVKPAAAAPQPAAPDLSERLAAINKTLNELS